MKRFLFLSAIIFTVYTNAQTANTLFWEISGNGLAKKSYVYGTMHVNEKISYHLSDAFFTNLLAADIVSNESDPETWEDIPSMTEEYNNDNTSHFYADFFQTPAKKKEIAMIFYNNYYLNNMVSVTNDQAADFAENTVLDMFIYQTGRKYKKKIVGLENAKASMVSLYKSRTDYTAPKEENQQVLLKILKNRNYTEAMNDLYREKDIVMLDSIYKLMFPKNTHKALIIDRNIIMTKSIDSLAHTGSLFAAVGAAHLAGKGGIIQLLRNKGYTVTPIIDVFTENGAKQKKTIEEYFPAPTFAISGTRDGMVKMPLNKNVISQEEDISSPDLTNGAVINIRRIPLNSFLNKEQLFNAKALDSLFFEKIAGDIIEKKYFEQDNFTGYDIKNKTKTGNAQRNKFYITPLELIAVSMTGTGNYVRQYENEAFDKIQIKSFKNTWEKFTPEKGGFSIEVPSFNTVYGNNVAKKQNSVTIQAYDDMEKGYYFLTEKTLNDINSLEDSQYEQQQIHYEFYKLQKTDSTDTHFDKVTLSFASASKGDKKIKLKSFIKGNKYYLLGTVNVSEKNIRRFFDSFTTAPFNYKSAIKIYNDTITKFKVEIPEKQNENILLGLNRSFARKPEKNAFESKYQFYNFSSESGKTVELRYYKYSKYETAISLDSIKAIFKKELLKHDDYVVEDDYEDNYDASSAVSILNYSLAIKNGFSVSKWGELMASNDKYEIVSDVTTYDKDKNVYIFDTTVSKPNATQAVKSKIFFTGNACYTLNTLVDRNYKNDDSFIEKTFNSFEPTDKNTASVFGDKIDIFIEDAKSEKDTIRYSAMESVEELKINKADFEKVRNFLNTFKFKDSETNAVKSLVEMLGKIKEDERVIPFLEALYKRENTKTAIQMSILQALANQGSKTGYKKLLSLLEYDLPLPDERYQINTLFYYFQNDLQNSKELFPKIFQFYSIPEYNTPIINLCNKLLEEHLVSYKKLNSFKKILNTNAKLECKRLVSWKEKNSQESDDEVNYSDNSSAPAEDLINYINLLQHFPDDKEISELLEKAHNLDIPELDIELARLGIVYGKYNDTQIREALDNPKIKFAIMNLLLNKGKTDVLKNITDDEIALSAVHNFQTITEKDSVSLLQKKVVENSNKEITFYFFKITKTPKEDTEESMPKDTLYALAFINDNHKINPLAYKMAGQKILNGDEDLEDEYQTIINKTLNGQHTRANYDKPSDNENFRYDDY
ncbi:MAG: TraB/GumN family protein [Flavobacterium sp.]|nr:TraB/GumN family protein [Flavobacterium sp.]